MSNVIFTNQTDTWVSVKVIGIPSSKVNLVCKMYLYGRTGSYTITSGILWVNGDYSFKLNFTSQFSYKLEFIQKESLNTPEEKILESAIFTPKDPLEKILDELGYNDNEEIQGWIKKRSVTTLLSSEIISQLHKDYLNSKNPEHKELYQNFLEDIIDYYNKWQNKANLLDDKDFYLNKDYPNLYLINNEFALENDYSVAISKVNARPETQKKDFDTEILNQKLPEGLYSVAIYANQNRDLVRAYYYVSFGEEHSNKKYEKILAMQQKKKEQLVDSQCFLETDYQFTDENEKHVLSVLASTDLNEKKLICPPPEIFIDTTGQLSYKVRYKGLDFDLTSWSYKLFLYYAEEDQLFNPDGRYRRQKVYNNSGYIDNDNNIYEDSIVSQTMNAERYYFWIGTENGLRVSSVSTFDITGQDTIDYTAMYGKICWKNYVKTFAKIMDVNGKAYSELKTVLDTITSTDEEIAYKNFEATLLEEVLSRLSNSDYINDIIIAIETGSLLYGENYDFDLIKNITYKQAYGSIVLEDELKRARIAYKQIDLANKELSFDQCYFHRNELGIYLNGFKRPNIVVINCLDLDTYRKSDFIMFYYESGENLPRIYTNRINVKTINGL